ncbi:MAG: hypothetical protein EOP06_08775 [Proteobacteria bacterium]|nr:MAG: hypothetical protein EOP06_08775 [Pseudomonadota bacterium]
MKLLIVCLAACFVTLPTLANEKGNGGDLCEIEYRGLIPSVLDWVKRSQSQFTEQELSAKLESALLAAQVSCLNDELILDGKTKSAISYKNPDRTDVNFPRWTAATRLAKQALVLHEGLVLIGVEKTDDYHISSLLAGSSMRAALVDVTCFADIQDADSGEHLQEPAKVISLKAGDRQPVTLLRSKNYSIRISPAGGIMLLFQRMSGESVLSTLGTSTIPAVDGNWLNDSKKDSDSLLSVSCAVSNTH